MGALSPRSVLPQRLCSQSSGFHARYELPLGGGAATEITPMTFGQGAGLLGADSTSVFYTLDGATILARCCGGRRRGPRKIDAVMTVGCDVY